MKRYLITRFKNKYTMFTAIAIILYSSLSYFNVNILALTSWSKFPKFTEANYSGFFSIFATTFIIIPIYYIYLQPNRIYFDKTNILFRFIKLKHYFILRNCAILIESSIFVLFLYFIMFLRAAAFNQQNRFFSNILLYIKFAILQILGYLFIGMIISYSSHLGNSIFGFAFSYPFVIYDYICMNTGNKNYALIIGRTIAFQPNNSHAEFLVFVYTIIIIGLLSGLFYFLVLTKDYLPKRANV